MKIIQIEREKTCSLYDMVKFNYKSAINAYGLCSLQFDLRRKKYNFLISRFSIKISGEIEMIFVHAEALK